MIFHSINKFLSIEGLMMLLLAAASISSATTPPLSHQVLQEQTVCIRLPEKQLAQQSLEITTCQKLPYLEWSESARSNVYTSLQKTVAVWEKNDITDQYLVYGKQQTGDKSFSWEVVPFQKPSTFIGRIWQQFLVLWRSTFGGVTLSEAQKQTQVTHYKTSFSELTPSLQKSAERINNAVKGNDAFCKQDVIRKQLVLEGRLINVLYNYAPIGFGGERLHFLIVPKAHKSKFSELSEAEYLEATKLSQQLITHFSRNRPIEDVYLFDKTGKDAGQTVPHWHQHLILTSNKKQGVFGKLTVLKNMLIGSSPLKGAELEERVTSLKSELSYLNEKQPSTMINK